MYIETYYYGKIPIEMWEYVAFVGVLFFIWLLSGIILRDRIQQQPEYRFFLWGLWAKVLGGFAFAATYIFYYGGGDTVAYYQSSIALCKLFYHDFSTFTEVYFSPASFEVSSVFSEKTGEPLGYIYFNDQTRFVMKLLVPFMLVCGNSYFITTLLISIVTYAGIWKLYLLFTSYFPNYKRNLAIAILFMPSVVFWGSGILKDSFTLTATCFFLVEVNRLIKKSRPKAVSVVLLVLFAFVIIAIKPYIFLLLLPGSLLWFFYARVQSIRSKFLRYAVVPFTSAFVVFGSYAVLISLGDKFGKFSPDKALQTAVVTQNDLKQEYYAGNSFDIGAFEPTLFGIASKFFPASTAGLFRPFIWEAENVLMVFSGLENLFILALTLRLIVSFKWKWIARHLFLHPLLLCSLLFAVLFAFMIGLTTSNFGALVRFKIPLVPLYMGTIMVLVSFVQEQKNRRLPSNKWVA
jgi:hypothetical protein